MQTNSLEIAGANIDMSMALAIANCNYITKINMKLIDVQLTLASIH